MEEASEADEDSKKVIEEMKKEDHFSSDEEDKDPEKPEKSENKDEEDKEDSISAEPQPDTEKSQMVRLPISKLVRAQDEDLEEFGSGSDEDEDVDNDNNNNNKNSED